MQPQRLAALRELIGQPANVREWQRTLAVHQYLQVKQGLDTPKQVEQ